MDKFSQGEELSPFLRIVDAENPKIDFNLLIGSFSLPISSGVVGSGEVNIVFKDVNKFVSKGRGKLWASIRDDGMM